MSERVVVTGIPGSGKDYLLGQARPRLDAHGFRQINFGEAMHAYALTEPAAPDSRDGLRTLARQDVAPIISRVMQDVLAMEGPTILNTHLVFKQADDYVCAPKNIAAFAPTHIVMVWAEPDTIGVRRRADPSRVREVETIHQIRLHQELAHVAAQVLAGSLDAQFLSLDNTVLGGELATNTLCEGVIR